ncbi:MAG: hypothetical protein ACFE8U_00985 [Candidatus Hermodarchaeota archaeon]
MKIHCDSDCRPCVLEGGPSRNLEDGGTAYSCEFCRSTFFCDVGIVQRFSADITTNFCIDCGMQLVAKPLDEIALEKAKFLMDNRNLSRSGKFRPSLASKKATRSVKSLSILYETKTTSAFHRSLITEMTRISGLTPQVISNFAREFGIGENVISNLSGDPETILLTLASVSPKFIEVLHSILIGRDPTVPGGLTLRFNVFAYNIANIVFVQPSTSLVESGPYDLIAYDSQGMRIWIFCVQGLVGTQELEKIVGPMLNQDLEAFSGVSEIAIVAQKGFTWIAKQLLKKYRGIVVTDEGKQRLIPFELWQEKSVPSIPEIAFENIHL